MIKEIVRSLAELGSLIEARFLSEEDNPLLRQVELANPWFTPLESKRALSNIRTWLVEDNLLEWIEKYPQNMLTSPKRVGIIGAGNIPLACLHDVICVLLSGNEVHLKPSSKDFILPKYLLDLLVKINPQLEKRIHFPERLNDIDAIIATGSTNTSRHFKYYFRHIPSIIRQNRNGIALIDQGTSKDELYQLGKDIFYYYGLGCRSVASIMVPLGYELDTLFQAIEPFDYVAMNSRYANNYLYTKSIYLLNGVSHQDNGFVLAIPNEALSSAVASFNVHYYDNLHGAVDTINSQSHLLQCVATNMDVNVRGKVPLGTTQQPDVQWYADGLDTMEFLSKLT